jgi:hypothetical protein
LVVNRLTELREERRWRLVAIVAYRGIGKATSWHSLAGPRRATTLEPKSTPPLG